MAKLRVKKSVEEPKKRKADIEEDRGEPVTEETPAGVKVDPAEATYHGDEEAEQLWYVTLADGRNQVAAIVRGTSKADAESAFRELNGILATEHPIRCAKVDEDHGYPVDKNGVVIVGREKAKRRRSHEEDDE